MRRLAAVAILLLAAGCRRPAAPTTPEATALLGFTPAGATLIASDDPSARIAARRLREVRDPRVVGTTPLPDGAVAVDVEASLGGGARGRYAIHVARQEGGRWRIVAIGGPGIAWPVRPTPPAEGLSESSPPR